MNPSNKSKKPIIGILSNIETIEKEPFLGQERACLNQTYINAIVKGGGIPVMLPVIHDKESIRAQISLVDGLVLSGGYDVHPLYYGEEPHPSLRFIYPERDLYEMEALSLACQQEKPILGICRGLQLINVAFGGTLYQDLSQNSSEPPLKHSQEAKMHVAVHTVDITPDTILHSIFGKDSVGTNSFHHQGIKQLASGLIASAFARDGVIEGIEKENYPFMVAVQWHPERMVDHDPAMLHLFQFFIAKALEFKEAADAFA